MGAEKHGPRAAMQAFVGFLTGHSEWPCELGGPGNLKQFRASTSYGVITPRDDAISQNHI